MNILRIGSQDDDVNDNNALDTLLEAGNSHNLRVEVDLTENLRKTTPSTTKRLLDAFPIKSL